MRWAWGATKSQLHQNDQDRSPSGTRDQGWKYKGFHKYDAPILATTPQAAFKSMGNIRTRCFPAYSIFPSSHSIVIYRPSLTFWKYLGICSTCFQSVIHLSVTTSASVSAQNIHNHHIKTLDGGNCQQCFRLEKLVVKRMYECFSTPEHYAHASYLQSILQGSILGLIGQPFHVTTLQIIHYRYLLFHPMCFQPGGAMVR